MFMIAFLSLQYYVDIHGILPDLSKRLFEDLSEAFEF